MTYKFKFGVNGNPLKSGIKDRKKREKRFFPKGIKHTPEYVAAYFKLNSFFVGVNHG